MNGLTWACHEIKILVTESLLSEDLHLDFVLCHLTLILVVVVPLDLIVKVGDII